MDLEFDEAMGDGDIDLAEAGSVRDLSGAVFVMRVKRSREIAKMADAMVRLLSRRGLTDVRAKQAVDDLLRTGRVFVRMPRADAPGAFLSDMAALGVAAARVGPTVPTPAIRTLRMRLKLSREQFADTYGFDVGKLRKWELMEEEPETGIVSYLHAIANDPEKVEQAYAPTERIV